VTVVIWRSASQSRVSENAAHPLRNKKVQRPERQPDRTRSVLKQRPRKKRGIERQDISAMIAATSNAKCSRSTHTHSFVLQQQNSNDPVTEIHKPAADFLFPAKLAHDRKNHSGRCQNAVESGRSHLSENKGRAILQGKFSSNDIGPWS
jgi:hypothetical protein